MGISKSVAATSVLLAIALVWAFASAASVMIGWMSLSSGPSYRILLAMGWIGPLIAAVGIRLRGRRSADRQMGETRRPQK
jgi:O-antigen/teichoic acid export membrane protein